MPVGKPEPLGCQMWILVEPSPWNSAGGWSESQHPPDHYPCSPVWVTPRFGIDLGWKSGQAAAPVSKGFPSFPGSWSSPDSLSSVSIPGDPEAPEQSRAGEDPEGPGEGWEHSRDALPCPGWESPIRSRSHPKFPCWKPGMRFHGRRSVLYP